MLIFSLSRITPCSSEVVYCLQPCKTNIHAAMFDTKQNNVESKANVAFFFGVNKTSICMTAFVPNFHLNRHSYICLYIFTDHQMISNSRVFATPCQ